MLPPVSISREFAGPSEYLTSACRLFSYQHLATRITPCARKYSSASFWPQQKLGGPTGSRGTRLQAGQLPGLGRLVALVAQQRQHIIVRDLLLLLRHGLRARACTLSMRSARRERVAAGCIDSLVTEPGHAKPCYNT